MLQSLVAVSEWSGPLIALGVIVVTVTIGRAYRRSRSRDAQIDLPEASAAIERLRAESERIVTDIQTIGAETVARAETRIRVLNELLVHAEKLVSNQQGADAQAASSRFREVYDLADKGIDVNEIAEHTGFERGELDLILSLRKKTLEREKKAL